MHALAVVLYYALDLYKWVIIIVAVLSWLIAFNVINSRNDVVRQIWSGLNALTEPALRPIRRFLPAMNGIDISPIIALLVILFLQQLIADYFLSAAMRF